MQASPAQQRLLLPLAAADQRIAYLQKQLSQNTGEPPELTALKRTAQPLRHAQLTAQREYEAQQRVLERLTDDLQTVAKRIAHDEKLLASSTDAKLAQQLEREIGQLKNRQDKLETQQLELLEHSDQVNTQLSSSTAQLRALSEQAKQLRAAHAATQTELAAELQQLQHERELLAAPITGELLAEYEDVRRRTGIGAAALENGVSGASGMQLSPGEVATVQNLAADELYYCSTTGAILVRLETA